MAYTFLKVKDSMAIGTSLYDEEGAGKPSSLSSEPETLDWTINSPNHKASGAL